MRGEDDKWVKNYRERLKDYSEPTPEEIWDLLEKELPTGIPVKTKFNYRKILAAAAIFLVFLSSISLLFINTPQTEYVKEAKTNISLPQPSGISEPVLPQKEIKQIAEVRTVMKNRHESKIHKKTNSVESEQQISDEEEPIMEIVTRDKNDNIKKYFRKQEGHVAQKRNYGYANSSRLPMNRSNEKDRDWSLGVSVGNSPVSVNDGHNGFTQLPAGMRGQNNDPYGISTLMEGEEFGIENTAVQEAYRQLLMNNINKETYTETKHRMPFTVGLSFRFNLSHGFSIETGVNYTMLSSDLKSGSESNYCIEEQKLHYIGIPIKGNWKFFDKKYVSLYVSAGGAFEKCVSGSLKSVYITDKDKQSPDDENIRIKPLQWSVTAAVGAQYNATRHIGVFIEPGIVYYFNDGSPVETIRKEKPFNFNLQMGLRFSY